MSIRTLKKDELKLLAEELGLDVPVGAKVIELKTVIENSDIFKCDAEFVQNLIDNILDDKKTRENELKSENDVKLELERIKLSQLEKELELANVRRESSQGSLISESESPNRNVENLIKSVKTLTIPVPTKAESFNLFFHSIERAFKTKSVPDDLKTEILLNILGERVNNLMIQVKEEDINNYEKLKTIILKEFQPTPQECLNSFRNAQKSPNENFVQYASRLNANFEYYCQLREVKDLKSLSELMVSDKLFCELERDLKTHIAVKQGEKWFRPHELGRECDIYLSSKGKTPPESLFARSLLRTENKRGERNYANKYRNNESKNFSNVYLSGVQNSGVRKCILCKTNETHKLCACPNFKNLTVNERVNIVKNNKLCFKCFSYNCRVKTCKAKNCFCGKPHNNMIHFYRENNENKAPETDSPITTQCNASVSNFKVSSVLLLTCSVYASNEKLNFNKLTRLLCDNGSERSWCTKSLADFLKLTPVRKEKLSVFSFGSVKPNEKLFDVGYIKLTSRYDPKRCIQIEVLITDTITAAPISVPNSFVQNILTTRGIPLADSCENNVSVEILIGADVFWQVVDSAGVERIDDAISCVPTLFGFALQGAQGCSKNVFASTVAINFCGAPTDVQMLWDLEALGINERQELNKVDEAFMEQFERNLKFVNGRYETNLLWKINPDELGNNYFLAKKRFDELHKGFSKNKWVADEYKEIISDQEIKGIIEECKRDKCEYFMPHRAVVREDKETTKVRVVYNCSSKSKGNLSLNDCLETGPNLNPNILDMILNFRKYKIAFNADIEKAFLMISISEEDRKFLKFLWYTDNPDEECKFMRMTRLPFGCKTSPFILSATIKHHIKKFRENKPKSFEMLNSALYVDDLYFGANSVREALELSSDAVAILKSGGFNLRKLRSNNGELEKLWVEKGLSDGKFVDSYKVKVLGLNWDLEKDMLYLEMKGLSGCWKSLKKSSKRSVLQTAATIFDPVGMISPFIVRIKLLLQEIWERAIDWDDDLPVDLREKWVNWCTEVDRLSDITIPRNCLLDCKNEQVEMHIFCDASPSAYGAVVYFKFCDKSGNYRVSFVMSKSRVAPLKKLTLPRLELMALVIGVRVGDYLKGIFKNLIDKIVFWSDSLIALYWVRGSANRWKPFVANRVLEIQEKSSPCCWCYCPSEENPADLLTRGISAENLVLNKRWWFGPDWLQRKCECWPEQSLVKGSPDVDNPEISKEQKGSPVKSFIVNLETVEQLWERISDWNKLQRVVAWCVRFVRNLRGDKVSTPFLEARELRESHDRIIKLMQSKEYSQEILTLKSKNNLKTSKLSQLNPFLDDSGLLRVGGRLKNSNLPASVKHQIILPKNHAVTSMIVRCYHLRYLHGGVQLISAAIRQKYWITGGKSLIRQQLRKCVTCTRFRLEFSKQIMADLPASRVNPGRAFLKCGTDFAGPFMVCCRRGRGVKPLKMFVCVFVCFVTKAVHLELVSDLSAGACIAAIKRFIARRGKPLEIYSDCGTNYIGAKNYFKMCSDKVGSYLADESVNWKLNVPSAPHFGGLWEAAVKSMKFHMRRVIGSQILTQEEFATCLAEIESVLNSRPLVATSEDPEDYSVITPGHFLICAELKGIPEPDQTKEKISIGERWRLITQISQSFWKSWSKDYLTQLQVRNKWRRPCRDLCIGDLVLIRDDNLPPLKWKMARVLDVYKGTDERVRVVNLKTASCELRRPIHKLVQLPVREC